MNTVSFTPNNHGNKGNPHSQYRNNLTLESNVATTGANWLKVFEILIAHPEAKVANTVERMMFGFQVIDNNSDVEKSMFEFNGFVGIDYQNNMRPWGEKRAIYRQFASPNYVKLNMHIFYKDMGNGSYLVKAYLFAPWDHKRFAIIEPRVNIPNDRLSGTTTNVVTMKTPQFMKTQELFSAVEKGMFIDDAQLAAETTGFTDYLLPSQHDLSYSTVVKATAGGSFDIVLKRSGALVSFTIAGQSTSTIPSGTIMAMLPAGYRPSNNVFIAAYRFDNNGMISPITLYKDGTLKMATDNFPASRILSGSTAYGTDDLYPDEINI